MKLRDLLPSWRTPSSAGATLARHRARSERERIREKAKQICREIGKPIPPALERHR